MLSNWVILLNFNLAAYCRRQMDTVLEVPDFGVFVVDNASRDDDYSVLRDACRAHDGTLVEAAVPRQGELAARDAVSRGARLVVFRSIENLGYSGGNNIALRVLHDAVGEAGQFIVANPDVELNPDAIHALAASEADICGPAIYERYMDGVSTWHHSIDFATGFASESVAASGRISALSGCCFKLSGRAISRYGFLPDENFLYDEEIKFFERVRRLGGQPVYLPHVQVRHEGSASIGKRSFGYYYYIFRNRLTYFLEIAGPRYRAYFGFSKLYFALAASIFWSNVKRRNWAGAAGVARGIWHGFLRRKGPYRR